jgi:hypothetical protein
MRLLDIREEAWNSSVLMSMKSGYFIHSFNRGSGQRFMFREIRAVMGVMDRQGRCDCRPCCTSFPNHRGSTSIWENIFIQNPSLQVHKISPYGKRIVCFGNESFLIFHSCQTSLYCPGCGSSFRFSVRTGTRSGHKKYCWRHLQDPELLYYSNA